MKRIVLIDLAYPYQHAEDADKQLAEMQSLVKTFNGVDVIHIIQHRNQPDKATFIGSGKVIELTDIVKNKKIDTVIINSLVNGSVLFNLTQALWKANPDIEVWDRIDLILNIFSKHARTAEAKLQIEIARMRHMGPRVYGLGLTYFSRQTGGIGMKGIGETNIELMKRHWRDQIKKKNDALDKLLKHHNRQMQRRKDQGIKTVSIIGYTNAGKTSLFNILTKKNSYVKDELFATLDSTLGKLYIPDLHESILISDTIGFIQNLPTNLIDAFKSTLLESIQADLLIHVIDVSDEQFHEKIAVVEQILRDLHIENKPRILALNKIDIAKKETLIERQGMKQIRISAKNNEGIDTLKTAIFSHPILLQ